MSNIITVFKERFKKEEITGLVDWYRSYHWEERDGFDEHIEQYENTKMTITQRTMILLMKYIYQGVLKLKEIDFDIENMPEPAIQEMLYFYDLQKPEKRYKEIKSEISSPQSFLTRIPYSVITTLYNLKRVPFDREIFVACLVRFNVWHGAQFTKALSKEASENLYTIFPADDFTLDILMGVFEMELGIDSAFYLEREYNIGAIIIKLVNDGKISREKIQQKLFEAFNNPTLKQSTHSWCRNVYTGLDFDQNENLKCQNQLIELLYNDRNLLANFSLTILKKLATFPEFNWSYFVESLDGIVYRKKFNGGLKTSITLLLKQFKKDTSLLTETCINLAPIFLQEENSIQMEAVKCYALLEERNEEVNDTLLTFVPNMHSETKAALSFLFSEEDIENENFYESYKQEKYIPKTSAENEKLEYISSEEDFIFLCTQVIKSKNGLDYELFLEALLRFYNIKDRQKKALQSALKMAKKINDQMYLDITAKEGIHHIMVAKLICIWLDEKEPTVEESIKHWKKLLKKEKNRWEYTANRCLDFYKLFGRIQQVSKAIREAKSIKLLSCPTHTNGSIEANVFFERLEQYEQKKQAINEADFNIALCRINRWDKIKARSKHRSEHREIVTYLLDEKASFDPKKMKTLHNSWMTAFIIKNPEKSATVLDWFYEKDNKWWQVDESFNFELGRRYSENYSWATLRIRDTENKFENKAFEINHFSYYLINHGFIIADISHWFLRDGYYLEPLYLSLILNNFRYLSELEANETKSVMHALLQSIENPKPLEQISTLFMCLSLFSGNTAIRNASIEWLLILIENKYLNMELFSAIVSQILSNAHHPIPIKRVSEQFEQLKQAGGMNIDVLYKTLESTLEKMDSQNLPKSFKNILHHYYEVLQITKTEIPANIKANLEAMLTQNAVKKEVKKLLGLG